MAYIENLDELKEESKKIDVEQILNLLKPGIKIHRSGNDLRTCCPVHDGADGKENFAININTHEWFCHSHQCKGANLIDLYAQSRKMDFLKAAEEFASHFKLKIKYRDHKATNGEYTPESVLTCWNESKPQGNDN